MQLWIVEHFHLHKKVPVLMNHNIWKNRMKVFNYSELHFSEVTSFKIHTLVDICSWLFFIEIVRHWFWTIFDIVDLIDPIPGLGQFHVNSKGYADAQ